MEIDTRMWDTCQCCGSQKHIEGELYFVCDSCGKEMRDEDPDTGYLPVGVQFPNNNYGNLHYCSWHCLFHALPAIGADNTIWLPYIAAEDHPGCTLADFLATIRQFV